jgi:hypothetical protein
MTATTRRPNIAAPVITFGIWVSTFAWIMIRFA